MPKFIIFNSENEFEIKKGVIKDGIVYFNDGSVYFVDKSKPLIRYNKRGLFGKEEIWYMLSWRSLIPAEFKENEKEVNINDEKYIIRWLEPIKPKFFEVKVKGQVILPKMLSALLDMSFMKEFGSYKTGKRIDSSRIVKILGIILFIAGSMLIGLMLTKGVKLW